MVRRYRRRYSRRVRSVKYSNETVNVLCKCSARNTVDTLKVPMVVQLNAQGMRKVKNFTLRFAPPTHTQSFNWALVYVPEKTVPQNLMTVDSALPNAEFGPNTATAVSMYEPNQNVIMSGTISRDLGQSTFRTRLARNLNSGDQIVLLIRAISTTNDTTIDTNLMYAQLNYVISF